MAFGRDLKETAKRNKESKKATARAERIARDKDRRAKRNSFDRGVNIASLTISVVFAFFLVRFLFLGNDNVSFVNFLKILQSAPDVDLSVLSKLPDFPNITADWGYFNFFRNFINSFIIDATEGLFVTLAFLGKLGDIVTKFVLWMLKVLF